MFGKKNIIRVNNMLEEFKPIAEAHEVNVGQLSLAWTFRQKGITHLLVGARNKQQALDNAKAGEVKISADEIAEINTIYSKYF
jgi:aryl-alcohol dehydrogenase-like predicted oxidoreductase